MGFKRIAQNTASNFIVKGLTAVLGLVSLPIFIHYLGASRNGLLVLAETIIGYFSLLGLSMPTGAMKYVAEHEARGEIEQTYRVINTTFYLFCGIGFVVCVVVCGCVLLGGLTRFNIAANDMGSAKRLMLIAGTWSILSWPGSVLSSALTGLQRIKENNVATTTGCILGLVLSMSAAMAGGGVIAVFIGQNIGLTVTWLWQYYLLKKSLSGWNLSMHHISKRTFRRVFQYSFWLMISQLAALLINQTGRLILVAFLPISALTVYQVVSSPFQGLKSLQDVLTSALFPAMSALGFGDDVRRMTKKAGIYVNAITALLGLMGVFFCRPFMHLWVGDQFLPYVWIAQMMCAYLLFQGSSSVMYLCSVAVGDVKNLSLIALTIGLINVPVAIYLTPRMGVAGVFVSMILVQTVSLLLQYWFVYPSVHLRARDHWVVLVRGQMYPWLAALALSTLWRPIQNIRGMIPLAVAGLLVGSAFSAMVWMLVISLEDRKRLTQSFSLRWMKTAASA